MSATLGLSLRDLPEWGDRGGAARPTEGGVELIAARAAIAHLDGSAMEWLAAAWQDMTTDGGSTLIADLSTVAGTWNRDMNASFQMRGWEDEGNEPLLRVIEGIESTLERAAAVGLAIPSPDIVRRFARLYAEIGRGGPVEHLSGVGTLDAGPTSWSAALLCACALVVASASVRPPGLVDCLSACLSAALGGTAAAGPADRLRRTPYRQERRRERSRGT